MAGRLALRLLRRLGNWLRQIGQNINLAVTVIVRFFGYILANFLLLALVWDNALFVLLLFAFNVLVLLYLCHMAINFNKIAFTARAIATGVLNAKTDVRNIGGSLRQHADVINKIGDGLNLEVAERVRSEKFKTELIANVSHDIRTPLTALINYVDLLKKQELHHAKAAEYLDVLDRNAQRLKDLTSDLIDLSKFSTGNVQLQMEKLNLGELIRQGIGEYSEKLAVKGLRLVLSLPEVPVYIKADGSHLWRILENLLSNIRKYALPQSRVYVAVAVDRGQVFWTQKNISDHPLNISPQRTHGTVCARRRLQKHRGQRPWPVDRQKPDRIAGRPFRYRHRRRLVQDDDMFSRNRIRRLLRGCSFR